MLIGPLSESDDAERSESDGSSSSASSVDDDERSIDDYVESKRHWVSDGSILLQIGNTRFKIHQSRIVKESQWFRRLVHQRAARRRANNRCGYQTEIDQALDTVEEVDGLDLYYLDFMDGPNHEQFEDLLTAMESGM